jgi:hypothetical protein
MIQALLNCLSTDAAVAGIENNCLADVDNFFK